MGHGEINVDKLMVEQFKERLQYDSLDYHTILYSDSRGYEYNFKTKKIRPFTSVLWYDVSGECFREFIDYFNNKLKIDIDQYEVNGEVEDPILNRIGYIDNGYIVINIDSMIDEIQDDIESINDMNINYIDLLSDFEQFFDYIIDLYDLNIKKVKEAIDSDIKYI